MRSQRDAPQDKVSDFVGQMHERLAGVSAEALRQGQPLLQELLTELGSTLEELRVAEEELRVQNEQLAESFLAVAQERQRYQDLFDAAPDAYLVTDRAGVIREANRAAMSLLGLTTRYLVGKPLAVFIPLDERPGFRQALSEAGTPARADEWELRLSPRRRPEVTVGVRVATVPGVGARPAALRWLLRDISRRRSAEAERFRLVVDAIPHIAWTTGPDGAVDYYNQRWYDYSGLDFAQTRDWGWEAVIHPDDLSHVGGVWRAALQAGTPSEAEYRLRRADGAFRWHLGRSEPTRDRAGRITGWVGTATDITTIREAEQAQAALRERDHTIATQLQAALLPPLPETVPGLALAKYYEAGLAEAGVGGDFYDVFALEKGCTALIVGDLSGKGLSAAGQVATVRNMLRAVLYPRPTLAEAVTELNRILAANGLLEGFATLFVGAYEAATGTLNYVNCGQEPALLRRAETGAVELLLPTGLVLGTIEAARYDENTVRLAAGDALAVFTDGLTEIGPSRREMLGIEGLMALLATPLPPEAGDGAGEVAECLVLRLISGLDAQAESGIRDDVCLLVGVVC